MTQAKGAFESTGAQELPVVRGTCMLVRVILGYLAHGETAESILRDFPSLDEADVSAVIAYAARAA